MGDPSLCFSTFKVSGTIRLPTGPSPVPPAQHAAGTRSNAGCSRDCVLNTNDSLVTCLFGQDGIGRVTEDRVRTLAPPMVQEPGRTVRERPRTIASKPLKLRFVISIDIGHGDALDALKKAVEPSKASAFATIGRFKIIYRA